ncbi:MAG TPA: outer membrane protein assembly factor BamD [Verrucomicrobiae bacterium]|jgi:outer membrane protein assembly factor BamD (BamD/ComL family)
MPVRLFLIVLGVVLFAHRAPAPLIYRPGEGWIYEPVGKAGKWQRERAKDQLDVALEAFNKPNYSVAKRAAKRVSAVWPQSDYAPQALYILGRCYEAERYDEKAFSTYRTLLQKYPKVSNYEEVLQRQYQIANRFLAGQWFRLWGVVPFFPSMEKTVQMYKEVIARGPHSPVAPIAQLCVGAAHEKRDDLPLAAVAYATAADRYFDQKGIAAESLYRAGLAYQKQAQKAEYDQSIASQAISTFTDFISLYPNDLRVSQATKIIGELKFEQARGALDVAQYYEKKKRRDGALVYYNEVIIKAPNSDYAELARERIAVLKARGASTPPLAPAPEPALKGASGAK